MIAAATSVSDAPDAIFTVTPLITRSPPSTLSSLAYVLVESSTRVVPSTVAISSSVSVYVPAVRNSVSSKNIALLVSYISS